MFFSFIIMKVSAQTPIIEITEEQDTFTPSSMADNWDYYVINPGSLFPNVIYQGLPTTIQYSSELANAFETLTTDRNPGETLPNHLKSSDSRNSLHPFFDDEELPRAVRTSTNDEASYSAKQLMTISLHMSYQFTFLAEDNVEYLVLINSSDPFYLDVDIKDDSAAGELNFETSTFPYPGIPLTGVWKETIPVFPIEEMTLRFTFTVNNPTIVALTPHKMGSRSTITIPANNTFGAEIVQDIPSPLPTDQEITAEDINKKIGFSLRQFLLPMVEGEYYKIYVFMNDLDPSTNQTLPFLLGENYHIISGTLSANGLLVRATADTKLTLVLYSQGYTNQEYTIYFRNVAATVSDTTDLELNVNTTLEADTQYFFTLEHPSMMAINYTGPQSPRFDILAESGIPGFPWIDVATHNDFDRIDGNLYANGLTDINWLYVPAGNYVLDPRNSVNDVMIHTVEVQSLSPSLSLTMNQNSVVAFEIPQSSVQFNQINRVNMSTSDHKNESITYQYSIQSKYNELQMIPESFSSVAMGNRKTGQGSWIAYDENNTKIMDFIPSRPREMPIVVVRPSNAKNTDGAISSFSANLVVTLTHPSNYYPLDTDLIDRSYLGTGVILLKSSVVSGHGEFTINDDLTTSPDQVLGIPLSMNQYQLYNITLYLEGNYTNDGDLNASFDGININGGNLGHIMVFDSETSGPSATNNWINLLVLAVSPTSYLYVDIIRNDVDPPRDEYGNCTLIVDITGLSVDPMSYNLTGVQNWNPDRLDGEKRDTDYIFDEIKPTEFPSGGKGIDLSFILLVGVVVVGVGGAVGGYYYYTTRRGV